MEPVESVQSKPNKNLGPSGVSNARRFGQIKMNEADLVHWSKLPYKSNMGPQFVREGETWPEPPLGRETRRRTPPHFLNVDAGEGRCGIVLTSVCSLSLPHHTPMTNSRIEEVWTSTPRPPQAAVLSPD